MFYLLPVDSSADVTLMIIAVNTVTERSSWGYKPSEFFTVFAVQIRSFFASRRRRNKEGFHHLASVHKRVLRRCTLQM